MDNGSENASFATTLLLFATGALQRLEAVTHLQTWIDGMTTDRKKVKVRAKPGATPSIVETGIEIMTVEIVVATATIGVEELVMDMVAQNGTGEMIEAADINMVEAPVLVRGDEGTVNGVLVFDLVI